MRLVVGLAGGVDHQEQMVAEVRHHQIVENAAGLVGELRVALPAGRNRHDVLRHQPFQCQRGVFDLAGFRAQRDLAHMRDVEQAGGTSDMQMFPQHTGRILHRHLIAGERHHLAAARQMQGVQGSSPQFGLLVARQHLKPSRFPGDNSPRNLQKAPSVAVPESIIPSADTSGKPLQCLFPDVVVVTRSVCLRVSGAVAPSAPALSRTLPT